MLHQEGPTCLPHLGSLRGRHSPRLLVRVIVAVIGLSYAPVLILLGASAAVVIAVVPFAVSLVARLALGPTMGSAQPVYRLRTV